MSKRLLLEEARNLLLNVNVCPFMKLTERYRTLNIVGKKGESAKTELIRKNLVKELSVRLGRYRLVKYLVPTGLALKLVKTLNAARARGHNPLDLKLLAKFILLSF